VLYDTAARTALASVGQPVVLRAPDRVAAALARAGAADGFVVVDLHDIPGRRIGYAAASPDKRTTVYAEGALPPERVIPHGQGAFGDLDYALYLGSTPTDDTLLYTDVPNLPLRGNTASTTVPFGTTALLFVTASSTPLAGTTSRELPWVLLIGGVVFGAIAAFVTDLLLRGRARAEDVAALSTELYEVQQQRSATLQRSLLPAVVPAVEGVQIATRYWPAATDEEVGGDFYDVFPIRPGVTGVVIGDVCGKGVQAAAVTAVARHTVRVAAHHVDDPAVVLRWAHDAIEAHEQGETFCTVCFVTLTDRGDGGFRLDVALGGHPQPLLVRAGGRVERVGVPGTVLGIVPPRVRTSSADLDRGDTVVLYTDGITDAPGSEGVSVEELSAVLTARYSEGAEAMADALRRLVDERRPRGSVDDMAVVVVAVTTVPANRPEATDRPEPVSTPAGRER
jgi:serine phosphatase RsbU (regulator of sigma subunit)